MEVCYRQIYLNAKKKVSTMIFKRINLGLIVGIILVLFLSGSNPPKVWTSKFFSDTIHRCSHCYLR